MVDYTRIQDVLCLLTEEVCFERKLEWGDRYGISYSLREIVPDCSSLK